MKKYFVIILILYEVMPLFVKVKSPLDDSYFIGEIPDSAAIGRGEAYVAVKYSPFAPYWNPAGIRELKINKFGISGDIFFNSDIEVSRVKDKFPLQEGRKTNFVSICGPQVGIYWRPLSNRMDKSTWTESGILYESTIDEKINIFAITVAVAQP